MISFACPYRLAFHHISALIPDISGIWEILSEFCVILGTDVSTFPLWTLEKPLVLEVVFGSFLGRDLRDLAGGCGSSEAPCGGAANSEAEEAQEVGGSQHQPRREAWEKSMEKNTKKFPWEIDGD